MSWEAPCSGRNENNSPSPGPPRSADREHSIGLAEKFSILHTQTPRSNSVCGLRKPRSSCLKDCKLQPMFSYTHGLNLTSTTNQELASAAGADHEGTQTRFLQGNGHDSHHCAAGRLRFRGWAGEGGTAPFLGRSQVSTSLVFKNFK